jgi:hypothetical protein
MPLGRRSGQVSIGPPRNDRNNPPRSNLRALLNRPLHAIEFEDSQRQRNFRKRLNLKQTAQRKLNAPIRNRSNGPSADFSPGGNLELLPDLRPQHAYEMTCMLAHQSGSITKNLVSNPPSACHWIVLTSQFSVLSKSTPTE